MKTKNILKIGVLSVILFALLISPVLKPAALKAADPDNVGSYWGGFTPEFRKEIQEIKTKLQEQRANDLCEIEANNLLEECAADEGSSLANSMFCHMHAFFVKQWCYTVKGVLEGFGKMFFNQVRI